MDIVYKIKKYTRVFIMGGVINAITIRGLNIGESYIPYKLGIFLNKVIPELTNIRFLNEEIINVDEETRIYLKDVNVKLANNEEEGGGDEWI